jgi:hypothetical protein
MRRILLSALLLLVCGGQAFPCTQAERNGNDRVIGFDGKEIPQSPMPDGEVSRKLSFKQLVCGIQQDEERDPLLPDPHRVEPIEMPNGWQPDRKFAPSFISTDLCGMIVFAVGLIGWIGLGGAVVIVERKR